MSIAATTALDRIGVGIDTARYGHRVAFLRPDRLPAAKSLTVLENQAGYRALQQRLDELHHRLGEERGCQHRQHRDPEDATLADVSHAFPEMSYGSDLQPLDGRSRSDEGH